MEPLRNAQQTTSHLLQAANRRDQAQNEITFAVLGKQQDAAKQAGAAVNELLSQAVDLGRQLADGRLDVRV